MTDIKVVLFVLSVSDAAENFGMNAELRTLEHPIDTRQLSIQGTTGHQGDLRRATVESNVQRIVDDIVKEKEEKMIEKAHRRQFSAVAVNRRRSLMRNVGEAKTASTIVTKVLNTKSASVSNEPEDKSASTCDNSEDKSISASTGSTAKADTATICHEMPSHPTQSQGTISHGFHGPGTQSAQPTTTGKCTHVDVVQNIHIVRHKPVSIIENTASDRKINEIKKSVERISQVLIMLIILSNPWLYMKESERHNLKCRELQLSCSISTYILKQIFTTHCISEYLSNILTYYQ